MSSDGSLPPGCEYHHLERPGIFGQSEREKDVQWQIAELEGALDDIANLIERLEFCEVYEQLVRPLRTVAYQMQQRLEKAVKP